MTWNDLNTNDPDTAVDFYSALFGWTFEKVPSDEVDYRVIKNGDRSNGGVMRNREQGMPSFWMPYFAVEDVEDAAEKASAGGGGKYAGPIDVPTGRASVLHDPAGAAFAVFEGEFDD
jgi:predicted enzyme related to lactoylglutathione lyase